MPAYVVFLREGPITDPDAMKRYLSGGREGIDTSKMKPLVVYGRQTPIEGDAPDGIVILEFPTVADAEKWYHSDGYQAAAAHRRAAAPYRGVIVEGF